MLFVLFGLPKSGKTFIGELLQKEYGFHFFDFDKLLTKKIIEK